MRNWCNFQWVRKKRENWCSSRWVWPVMLLFHAQADRECCRFSKWALYYNEIFKSVHIFCCTSFHGNSTKLNTTNTIHLIQNVAKCMCVRNWMGKAFTRQDIDTGKLIPIWLVLYIGPWIFLHDCILCIA